MEEIILIFNNKDIRSIIFEDKFYINILDLIKSFEINNNFVLCKIKDIYYTIKLRLYKIKIYCKIEDIFKALTLIYNKKSNIELISANLLKLKEYEKKGDLNKRVDSINLDSIKLDIIKSLFK